MVYDEGEPFTLGIVVSVNLKQSVEVMLQLD